MKEYKIPLEEIIRILNDLKLYCDDNKQILALSYAVHALKIVYPYHQQMMMIRKNNEKYNREQLLKDNVAAQELIRKIHGDKSD